MRIDEKLGAFQFGNFFKSADVPRGVGKRSGEPDVEDFFNDREVFSSRAAAKAEHISIVVQAR